MITERENFFKMLRRERPEFVPHQPSLLQMVIPSAIQDRGPGGASGCDWFGVKWVVDPAMPMAAVADANQKPILEDICDWRDVIKWPDLSQIDWAACAKKDIPEKDPSKILFAMMPSGPFERLHDLMGFEGALCALMTDPEECGAFFSRLCDLKIEEIKYLKKYYDVDIVQFHDDWGNQKDLFFDPKIWHELIEQNVRRVVEAAHEAGVLFDMHSCGKIDRIVDSVIGMGIDVLDPAQPVNDLKTWHERYKNRVIFMGALNAQDVIDDPHTTPEAIRAEARDKINMFSKDGYLIPFAVALNLPHRKIALDEVFMYGRPFYGSWDYDAAVSEFKRSIT